jgi:hypothetical protein
MPNSPSYLTYEYSSKMFNIFTSNVQSHFLEHIALRLRCAE